MRQFAKNACYLIPLLHLNGCLARPYSHVKELKRHIPNYCGWQRHNGEYFSWFWSDLELIFPLKRVKTIVDYSKLVPSLCIRFKTILSYCAHCRWGAFVHICNVLQSEAWLGNNITHAPSAHLALELDSKTWNSSNIRMHPQHRPGT